MTYSPNQFELVAGTELSNEDYHSVAEWFSSSQIKEAVGDLRTFHKKYITKEIPQSFSTAVMAAMDVGTYYHTAILEPENLDSEFAVWEGIRKGKAYEEFLEANKGKIVLTAKDMEKAHILVEATKDDSVTMGLLSEGEAELSAFGELDGLSVRVRADWIDMERGFILDLKSTTGSVFDDMAIRKKIDTMNYDLSAALYLDTFNAVMEKLGYEERLSTFYWSFASKDSRSCQVYKATNEMIAVGRAKYKAGVKNILKGIKKNWKFPPEVLDAAPLPWQRDLWLQKEEKKPMQVNTSRTSKKKKVTKKKVEENVTDLL